MRSRERDLQKYGEPITFDRSFKGPLTKRSCTDIPCLLIFFIFLGAWGYIAHYAITNGDLNKLLVPTDSQNRKCGIDSQVLDKKYLFFFNLEKCIDPLVPIMGCPTPQICVSECPSETFVWDTMKNLPMPELKKKLICQTEQDKARINSVADVQIAIDENRCARWYVKSAPFLNRCMWEFSSTICEFIPSFLLDRSKRDLMLLMDQYTSGGNMLIDDGNKTFPPEGMSVYAQTKLADEPLVQCKTRQKLGESIIRHKMQQTDTYLARMVGNFVAHFYNAGADAQQSGQKVVEDITNSWMVIFLALVIAMVVSLLFITFMRWIAGPVLWFSILGVLTLLGYGIYICVQQYSYWKNTPSVPNHSPNLSSAVNNVLQKPSTWLVLTILASILFVTIFLVVIFLRKRIVLAIALVKEGSKAVSSVFSTVFFPIFPWTLYVLTIAFALAIGLYLASIGDSSFKVIRPPSPNRGQVETCICTGPADSYNTVGASCDPAVFEQYCSVKEADSSRVQFYGGKVPCSQTGCFFETINHPTIISYFQAYNVVGFFWLAFFISALGEMVLAATFATWYWTFHKSDVPYFTLTKAFTRTVCYHMGTLAFGALILTICRIIRLILEYIDEKLKKFDNPFTRAVLCCMKCFFWCLESFLRFLNRNAYIMCAIHGKNFCSSAKDAFNLLMRNFLRVFALDKVTDFLFLMSKVLLTAAAGMATYSYVDNFDDIHRLHYSAVPTTIVVVGTFLITSVFFRVYSMAVDTLFLCFLEDSERNDGSAEKPYFMSKQLMKILGKHNEIPRHQYE